METTPTLPCYKCHLSIASLGSFPKTPLKKSIPGNNQHGNCFDVPSFSVIFLPKLSLKGKYRNYIYITKSLLCSLSNCSQHEQILREAEMLAFRAFSFILHGGFWWGEVKILGTVNFLTHIFVVVLSKQKYKF